MTKKFKILIVDDIEYNITILEHILRRTGMYDTITTRSSAESIKMVKAQKPDLMLVDAMMPEINGFELCNIFKNDPNTRNIPIIMVTALKDITDKVKALEAGADDFLSKPLNEIELLARVKSLLRIKQQAEEIEKLRTDFTSMLVHDLRAPTTSIMGYTDILVNKMAGEINEQQEEFLELISKNGERLLNLINNLLDLSKIEAGKLDIHPFNFDLNSLIDGVIKNFKVIIDQKKINLIKNFGKIPSIFADESRLEQVVTNLISNAVKFCNANGEITIATESVNSNNEINSVKVSIQDSGIGIQSEELPLIFEKYKQASSAKVIKQKGTGLGLTISKMIVESHGGRIWVESPIYSEGKGSRFSFIIPISYTFIQENQKTY